MPSTESFMRLALDLARRGEGRTRPNPAVGALIVRDGQVVGEGFHPQAGQPHAEIFALRQAGDLARGADLYVTLEPCSHHGRTGPCAAAVIAGGLARVFVGTRDPNPLVSGRGIEMLRSAGIEVTTGILESECRRLIAPFAKHVTSGRPYLILKSAMTLDGNTATRSGDSQWISNEQSRLFVHRLRDRVDAIMVGIGTVLRDDPRLTTRLPEGGRDPLRVVVDGRLRIPEDAAMLRLESAAATLIATTAEAPAEKVARLRAGGADVLVVPGKDGRVGLAELMRELGARGIQSLLLEGGATLNAAALEAGLVDRVMLFVAPKLLGGFGGKGIFAGAGVERLAEARLLEDLRVTRFGDDILVEGEVRPCSPG
ncbi:riboflavin biosynthesis protein RibD [Desulfuromonas versatilis]|uniref:Riboflavin biosynthesis protein RibD n=1 Tax=Desulfuromonas versatilis TaxID=2802975 RepID=A0ABM8HS15_9BACT|nr:bifunctional diaminohydroxyphosphoribosylaminopyrimidine deaminase/5-amino-6-(5-phosphoribosylamino)uracil reductase RibD [Desulfuromonas versatilis]BCR04764.1 riboflavin biosynthesis protein RibD [Desulfuromonas versatilis]